MRHRIHLPATFTPGDTLPVTGDELHHAVRVVRVREGEEVEVFDGRGAAARAVVARLTRDALDVRITEALSTRESPLGIDLAMSIIQLEKFELVLQKATELGVRSIVPLVTERIEVRAERYRGKADRWQKIVFEAVKQCGRAVVPTLEAPAEFEEVIQRDATKILFDAEASADGATIADSVLLFIGPEGGFSDAELALAREHRCAFQRLGPRRLRAETAAIVAVANVAAAHGDLRS